MNRYEPLLNKHGDTSLGVTPFHSSRTSTMPLVWLYTVIAVVSLATVFIVAAPPAVLVGLVVIGVFMMVIALQGFIKNYTTYRDEENRKTAYLKTTVIPYFDNTYEVELPGHILNALLDGRGKLVTVIDELQFVRLVKNETGNLVLAKDIFKEREMYGVKNSSSVSAGGNDFIFFPVNVYGESPSSSSGDGDSGDSSDSDGGGDGGGD